MPHGRRDIGPGIDFMIKICGLTSLDEALLSVKYGANALGFNFYPKSSRFLTPEDAQAIIRRLPSGILTVGVMVVEGEDFGSLFSSVCEHIPALGAFQLHGLESASQVPAMEKRLIVATSPSRISRFPDREILVDTSWGTGKRGDWEALAKLQQSFILSGGLTAENVTEALDLLSPVGVDACSGVERSPGVKDGIRLERFIKAVKTAIGSS